MKIVKKCETRNIIIRISSASLAFLKWITLGRCNLRYDERTTTLCRTVFTGTKWLTLDAGARARILGHEIIHIEQWERFGILYKIGYMVNIWTVIAGIVLPIVGAQWWVILVALVGSMALPAGLSFRAYFEYQAFCESLTIMRTQGAGYLQRRDLVDYYSGLLIGKSYYFAGIFVAPIIRKAFQAHCDKYSIGRT